MKLFPSKKNKKKIRCFFIRAPWNFLFTSILHLHKSAVIKYLYTTSVTNIDNI